jgi:DnaK suppressor protein
MAPDKDASSRDASSAAGTGKARKRWPKGGPTKTELKRFRQALVELRQEILKSSQKLADEALKSSGQDFSVDHMADHGTDNFDQDFSLSLLEGERETLREIQRALEKIDGAGDMPYGLCEECAEEDLPEAPSEDGPSPWIARGRLGAVPYARLCVPHQEREEESLA